MKSYRSDTEYSSSEAICMEIIEIGRETDEILRHTDREF